MMGVGGGYPVARLRDDYKQQYNRALHVAECGFADLVETLQWEVFAPVVFVDSPQGKGEKG